VYADIVSGNLVRIKYAAGNRAPFAAAAQNESRSKPDQLIAAFDASGSYDLDGDPLTYSWNFGDGKSGTGIAPVHQYASAAPVTVTLTVSDGRASGTATLKVSPANHPPHLSVTLTNPPPGGLFAVGDPIHLSATATDVEDGNLTSSIHWQSILLHCPFGGPCHVHPDITETGGTFDDTFSDHGGDTSMVITATVTDSAGATVRVDTSAKPDIHTLSVTSPYPVNIDGFVTSTWRAVAGEFLEVHEQAVDRQETIVLSRLDESQFLPHLRQNPGRADQYGVVVSRFYHLGLLVLLKTRWPASLKASRHVRSNCSAVNIAM
jgi:hypothetical protein